MSLKSWYAPKIDHTAWTETGYMGASLLGDALKKLGLNVTRRVVAPRELQREGDSLKWKSIGYDD